MSCYHFWQSWENQNQNKSKRGEALLLPPQIVMGVERRVERPKEIENNVRTWVLECSKELCSELWIPAQNVSGREGWKMFLLGIVLQFLENLYLRVTVKSRQLVGLYIKLIICTVHVHFCVLIAGEGLALEGLEVRIPPPPCVCRVCTFPPPV